MIWTQKQVHDHYAAKFAEIDREVDAVSIDTAAVDKDIAEMLAARKLKPADEPDAAAPNASSPDRKE